VLHDFYVPEFRAKMDLVPGIVTYFWFTPTKIGEFEILCSAFCGIGHPQMRAKVVIESDEEFKTWLAAQQTFAQSRRGEAVHDRRASAQ
jgi:cytochrome c oxidase subunit II